MIQFGKSGVRRTDKSGVLSMSGDVGGVYVNHACGSNCYYRLMDRKMKISRKARSHEEL
jgi:hypothetical protein